MSGPVTHPLPKANATAAANDGAANARINDSLVKRQQVTAGTTKQRSKQQAPKRIGCERVATAQAKASP